MLKRLSLGGALLVASMFIGSISTPAQAAQPKPVTCELTVNGKLQTKGQCLYYPEENGSFSIEKDGFAAQLTVTGPNKGEVHWNEGPPSTHMQAPLGPVVRKGACWVSARVKLCATALSPQQTKAIMAGWPDGFYFAPEGVTGGICLGPDGPIADGTPIVMHNCTGPFDNLFLVGRGGKISISKHPDLCVDMEAPGMMHPPQLTLMRCANAGSSWVAPARGQSGLIKSTKGQCIVVPDLDDQNARFPFVLIEKSCAKAGEKALKVFVGKD